MIFGKTWQSFLHALNGLKTVWKEEKNFRIEIVIAVIVALLAYYFNFSFVEASFVIIAIIVVLLAEITNTVIEDLSDKIDPSYNPTMAKIKDTAAAIVLVSVIGAIILGVLSFAHHFWF